MKPINNRYSDAQLKAILQAERTQAIGAQASSDLSEQRAKALEYYMGQMDDMPANEGESAAVSSDVQDAVEGLLPLIVDILTSGGLPVEFKPNGPGDIAQAKQESKYVDYVFNVENDGFLITYTAVKDILLQKNGFIKWWMGEEEDSERESYKGLTEDAYTALTADEDGKIIDTEKYELPDVITQAPTTYYNAIFEKTTKKKVRKCAAIAPEKILVSKTATNIVDANYWAHVDVKAQADIIAAHPDKADVIRLAPSSYATFSTDNDEGQRRATVQDNEDVSGSTDSINKEMRQIEIVEHYIRIGLESEKAVRKYKITTVGDNAHTIVDIEEVPAWNIACGTGIVMSHRLIGRAVADLVMDIQQIKTSLLRSTLNNAYYANNNRWEISETHSTENTIDDVMNNRVGGIIRTKMPGGLVPHQAQPIGHWVMPVMEFMDSVGEKRTGISKNNTGMGIDDMNHARTGAVNRIMDAAEMRIKLIARTIAETLFASLYRGLHGMLQQYDEARDELELSPGEFTSVNPREWKKRKHMRTGIPLGGVGKQQLLGFFAQILGVQKEVLMQQGGPNGPLVSYQNIYNTLDQMTQLAGLPSVDPFFMKPGPHDPNAPPPPNPEMVKAQGQIQADQAKQQADQQANAQKLQFEQQMEVMRAKINQQNEQVEFQHKQQLDKMKFAHDVQMAQVQAAVDMKIEAFKAQEAAKLNAQQAKLSAKQGVGNV